MTETPSTTEVAVVGGGVIGTSIAFHLAEAGVDVTLFERGALGGGAPGSAATVLRTYFPSNPRDSMLAMRSLSKYQSFATRCGANPALAQVGSLIVLTEPGQLETFRADVAVQRYIGVSVELIDADRAADINPLLRPESIAAAVWAPQAFTCAPAEVVRGYVDAAGRHGAQFCVGTEAVTVDVAGGVVGTEYGETSAKAVVCAAGPWSQGLAAMCGVRLPVSPKRTELLLSDPLPSPHTVPLTRHAVSGLQVRSVGDRLLVGMGRPAMGEHRAQWARRVSEQFDEVYPALAGIPLHHAWSEVSGEAADHTAFIGESAGPGRFLYAAGFSGHGYSQAPAAGELIRDLYLGRAINYDLSALSHRRAADPPRSTRPQRLLRAV